MLSDHAARWPRDWLLEFCLCVAVWTQLLVAVQAVRGDELHLSNGMILEGTVVRVAGLNTLTARQNDVSDIPNYPFYMVDDGVRRYFIPARHGQQQTVDHLNPNVTFNLFHQKSGRAPGPAIIGTAQLDPFDQYGRRTVTLSTARGPVHIVQGITIVRPDWVKVEGLTHDWEHRLDTRMIPDDVLERIVQQATDQQSSEARRQAVLFMIQAKRPRLAQLELERISRDFPELADWCQEFSQRIRELQARQGINEIQLRRLAGQHALANYIARQVPPDGVSPAVLFEAREIIAEYDTALERRDRVLMLLDLLHAELDPAEMDRLRVMRAELQEELHFESITRLDPLLRVEDDQSLTAPEKLALAYSSWLLGPDRAITRLSEARDLWTGRQLMLEYLRTGDDSLRRDEILAELRNLEGLDVARAAAMVNYLPLPGELPPGEPSAIHTIEFAQRTVAGPRQYSLLLPPEYSPHRSYPLLIVLRAPGQTSEQAIRLWAGDAQQQGWAQRRGYIVMAPEYLGDDARSYSYSADSHAIVRESLQHVRKLARVDSDRVFLAGHGIGANAVFDVALSAPDLFAGAIAVAGQIERHPVFLWANGSTLSWYIVGGERDRETLEVNAVKLNRMMSRHQDIIYCDYKARGFEPYGEEQERIFEWMQTKRRLPLTEAKDFELGSLRVSDHRFHWFAAHDLPERLFPPLPAEGPVSGVAARRFEGHIAPGGPIYVKHPGKGTTLWLNPELIDFDIRHRISINNKVVSTGFIEPSLEALLEDLRLRGDRERLYWAKLTY